MVIFHSYVSLPEGIRLGLSDDPMCFFRLQPLWETLAIPGGRRRGNPRDSEGFFRPAPAAGAWTTSPKQQFIWRFPEIGGTPKSSILIGFSIVNHPAIGIPHLWNQHFYPVSPPSPGPLGGGLRVAKRSGFSLCLQKGGAAPSPTCVSPLEKFRFHQPK